MHCLALFVAALLFGVASGTFSGGPPMEQGSYRVDLNKLYQKTGLTKDSAGRSCGELITMGRSSGPIHARNAPAHAAARARRAFSLSTSATTHVAPWSSMRRGRSLLICNPSNICTGRAQLWLLAAVDHLEGDPTPIRAAMWGSGRQIA